VVKKLVKFEFKIAEALIDHFIRVFIMLKDAIEIIPSKEWKISNEDNLIPARQAIHMLECAVFYCSTETVESFPWGQMFGGDYESMSAESLPSQETVLEKSEEIKKILIDWLKSKNNSEFLAPEQDFSWTGKTILARTLYLLRHFQHHQGVLHAELHRRGITKPGWQ